MTIFRRLCLVALTALTALTALWIAPTTAEAEPQSFRRPRMTFSLGLEAFDYFMGDFGDAADVGLSVSGDVTIQVGYFAGNLRFGSARAFTHKDFLPYDEGFQNVFITAAPRFYFAPFRKLTLYFFIQPEISMRFLVSNTLVALTGNESITGSVGGAIGTQYIAGIIAITGQVACEYDWRLDSIIVTGGLSIGLSSTLN